MVVNQMDKYVVVVLFQDGFHNVFRIITSSSGVLCEDEVIKLHYRIVEAMRHTN